MAENIGLNYDTFTSSVLLLQGKAEKLLDSTAKGRFEVLAGIVDLDRYQRLHKRADEQRKELDDEGRAAASPARGPAGGGRRWSWPRPTTGSPRPRRPGSRPRPRSSGCKGWSSRPGVGRPAVAAGRRPRGALAAGPQLLGDGPETSSKDAGAARRAAEGPAAPADGRRGSPPGPPTRSRKASSCRASGRSWPSSSNESTADWKQAGGKRDAPPRVAKRTSTTAPRTGRASFAQVGDAAWRS